MSLRKRLVAALLVWCFFIGVMAVPCAEARSLSQWRDMAAKTSRKLRYYRSILREVKRDQRNAANRLAASDKKVRVARISLADIRSQLKDTRRKLRQTKAEIAVIESRLKDRNDLLAGRLVDSYKYGDTSYVAVLLGSDNFTDMANRGYVLQKVVESDLDLLNAFYEDRRLLEEKRAVLEVQEQERARLTRKLSRMSAAAEYERKKSRKNLDQANSDRIKYERMLAQLQHESEQISQIISQMQQTPEGRQRAGKVWKGRLASPLNGRITSRFGPRIHPIWKTKSFHTGVDIAAPLGSTIRAAEAGEVIYCGYGTANGKYLIVDHGGGVSTVYAHCSDFLVSKGDQVNKGQAIAHVGMTGWTTGPHLHFEVRKNGKPVNPL